MSHGWVKQFEVTGGVVFVFLGPQNTENVAVDDHFFTFFFLAVSRVCVLDCGTSMLIKMYPFIHLKIEHWNTRQYGCWVSGATSHISQSSLEKFAVAQVSVSYLNSAEAGYRTSFGSYTVIGWRTAHMSNSSMSAIPRSAQLSCSVCTCSNMIFRLILILLPQPDRKIQKKNNKQNNTLTATQNMNRGKKCFLCLSCRICTCVHINVITHLLHKHE